MSRPRAGKSVRLQPADSFDLIRLLARSQHDPRKAVCELVQNSLDARARHVEVTWFNEGGVRAIRIRDDGEGIFPDLPREQALERIARTIGHSYKRSLTPEERRQLMLLGKYGIGLLGFWSVGVRMEVRSRVGGGEIWSLRLVEDEPRAEVALCPPRRLDEGETFTDVTIRGVHEGAARQLRPTRLQPYLANELRGQLLAREVRLEIHDRVSRGRARKLYSVEPPRFISPRLDDLVELAVPDFGAATLELHLLPPDEERQGRVGLSCGGTAVLGDLAQLDDEAGGRAPWSSGRVEGVIDFPDLSVAPGTRRGFQRDAAAMAFIAALEPLEVELTRRIEASEEERTALEQESLAREIRRAFVPVASALPEYDMLDVRAGRGAGVRAEDGSGAEGAPIGAGRAPAPDAAEEDGPQPPDEEEPVALFPPGPLASVRIDPARAVLPPGAVKWFRARPLDADGRPAAGEVILTWRLDGAGDLTTTGPRARYGAPAFPGRAALEVSAEDGRLRATARAEIEISEELAGREKASGIPEPHPVHAPREPWRSRLAGERWEFNAGHRDYLAAAEQESSRLRYLIHLFAKELVLRNFGGPGVEPVLERMVEVLTHLGRRAPTPSPRRRSGDD